MINKREIGKNAEDRAARFLETKGYKILQRNYTIRGGEIDIIAEKNREVVFVEVKSLSQEDPVGLEETISRRKLLTLERACQVWLIENKCQDCDWKIEFVGVKIERGSLKKIVHLPLDFI